MSGIKTVYLFMFVHLLIVEVIGIENGEKLLVPIRTSNCCGLYTKIYTKNIYSIMYVYVRIFIIYSSYCR